MGHISWNPFVNVLVFFVNEPMEREAEFSLAWDQDSNIESKEKI